MGFKMKLPRIYLALFVGVYAPWGSYGFAISDLTPVPLGVDMGVRFDVSLSESNAGNPACVYDTGNGELSQHQLSTLDSGTYTVNFPDSGYYDITAVCLNNAEYATITVRTYVGNYVTGLSATAGSNDIIIPSASPVTIDVILPITFTTGTDANVTATVLESGNLYTGTGFNESVTNDLIFSKDEFDSNGMYAIRIEASNPLTPSLNITVVLAVLGPINVTSVAFTPTSYAVNPVYVMTNLSFEVVTNFAGEDAVLTWEIIQDDAGTNTTIDLLGFFCAGPVPSHSLNYMFNVTGTFYMILTVSNYINEYVHQTISVVSYYGVNGFSVDVTDETSLISNSVDFAITVLDSANFSMGTVVCNFDYGNGIDDSHTFDYTTSLSPLAETKTYLYPEIGHFRAVVKCSNELPDLVNDQIPSYLQFGYDMIILNEVDHLVLTHNSVNISNHPFSKELAFTVALDNTSNPQLPNITCSADFGDISDPAINVTGDATSSSNVLLVKPRFSTGEKNYSVVINCSNELTSHVFPPVDVFVYFDCWRKSYFDHQYRFTGSPLIAFTHLVYTVRADVKPANISACVVPLVLKWEVFDDTDTLDTSLTPATTTTFSIPPHTFENGIYKFQLTTTFTGSDHEEHPALTDYCYVRFDLPDLHPKITGAGNLVNPTILSLRSSTIVIDSRGSLDPAENPDSVQSWLTAVPVTRQWKCYTADATTTDDEVVAFTGLDPLPAWVSPCPADLLPGGNNLEVYELPPDTFDVGIWYLYTMNYSRGSRSKVAVQAVKVYDQPPLSLEIVCVLNCYKSANTKKKVRAADLQLNIAIRDPIDNSSCTYEWTLKQSFNESTQMQDISHLITDPRNSTGIRVPESIFKSHPAGTTFQVSCTVTPVGTEFEPTTIYNLYKLNYPAYGGSCTIDKTEAVAASTDVCISCSNYKDENQHLERNPDLDEGGALEYEILQIDANFPEIFLDSSSNQRQCVKLRKPRNNSNITMVELRVKDDMGSPYAYEQYNVTIEPPLAEDITGSDGADKVSALMNDSKKTLTDALAINDSHTVATFIGALASCLTMGGELVIFNVELEVEVQKGGINDVNEDGTVVSVDQAFDDIQKKPVDATALAIREAKASMANNLATSQGVLSDQLKSDPTMQRTLLSAAKTIVLGEEQGIDNRALTITGNILASTIESFEDICKTSKDTDALGDLIEEMMENLGIMAGAISPNDEGDFRGVLTLEAAENDLDTQFDFADKEIKGRIDEALMSERERAFFYLKQQRGIDLRSSQRRELGGDHSDRINLFLYKLMANVEPSDSTVLRYGDKEDSPAISTTTRITPDKVKDTKLDGRQVAVKLPEIVTAGKINIGMVESKTVVNTDSDGRFAQITSDEVHFELQMEAQTINGLITIEFKVKVAEFKVVYPFIVSEDANKFHRDVIWVNSPDDMVCLVNKPLSDTVDYYKVWISCSGDVSKLNFDAEEILSEENSWGTCFLPVALSIKTAGICHLGIEIFLKESDASTRRKRAASNSTTPLYPPMNSTAATMACLVLDENRNWQSDRCNARWLAEEGKLLCDCIPQKKMTFANSFYVAPNRIDFGSVFLKFSPQNQAAVMGTLAGLMVIYVVIVVWARRKDKKDLLKWGITPLADNFAEDNYFYVIKVYTGMRPGAGTRSKVGMVIAGEEMDTGVRELSDGVRKEFTTGSVMNFLMSVTVYLGDLEYVRIWHDNSGPGNKASWYLSKLEIQDVQRNETFTFLAERWLAVEKDDGLLECVVPVCQVDNLNVFKNRFYMNAKENLAESHIWVSVVYRPMCSHFTRVQRATCALVFLMLTMISNAMFFQGSEDYETPASVQVGPFRFTMQQIYISLICALITTPGTLIIIYLFKLSKPKPAGDKPLFSMKPDRSQRYKIPLVETWFDKQQRKSMELEQNLVAKGYPQFQGFCLPYWCAYVAWFLAFAAWFLSGFFIMLYSMDWGKQKSEEWLTTFFLSFFESVFCLDPVKIAVMAVVFSILIRSAQDSKAVIDRTTIMKKYKSNLRGKSGGIRLPAPPLDTEKLDKVRAKREIELRMKTAMKDIVLNIFIIWILFSLSFSTRDIWSYNMHQETVETLLKPDGQMSFYDIKTTNEYFDWLNNTAIVNLFPEKDYTGANLHWRLRQFLQDGAKYRVGPPRLRQLRTTERDCKIPYMGTQNCYTKYSEPFEDTKTYCIGWNSTPCDPEERVYKYSSEAWEFTSAFDIWGFPITGYYTTYGGGGYIAKLSVNREVSHLILDELYQNSWVDRQTRAVIFEFTLYCLNTNIFTYNLFMAEFPETGGVFPYVMILPLRVYMHNGALGMYTLMCEILFLIYLVVITVMTIILIVQQKKGYFKKPWQVYDLIFIIISYFSMIMYFVRFAMTTHSLSVFKEDKKAFVNFFHIALWDQIFVLMVGILVFMSILRMLNVFGYNKRISAVVRVFTNAASQLVWFGIFFMNVFTCYAVFGYLLFGSKLRSYMNVFKTMGTLFISMIGKSRFTEIEDADPILSKIYFMIFIFFVVYMILTMFLAVLSKSIDQVHADTKTDKADELVDYVINKFKNMMSTNQNTTRREVPATPAPWSTNAKGRWEDVDHRAILEDIRTSLNEAIVLDPEGMQKKARPGFRKKGI